MATEKDFYRVMNEFTMPWEGWSAVTDNPADPGGLTKFGISQRYHPELDVKNLTLDGAMNVYLKEYWYDPGVHRLPMPLAAVALDCAIHAGPAVCHGILDSCMGDWETFNRKRLNLLVQNANKPAKREFYRGWVNRLDALNQWCARWEKENQQT
jgi:lysozyme family protein